MERRVGLIAEVVELLQVGRARQSVGLGERILADHVARLIEAETDIAESAFAIEVVLSNSGAGVFELVKCVNGVEGKDDHERKESAEPEKHGRAGTDAGSDTRSRGPEKGARFHRRRGRHNSV